MAVDTKVPRKQASVASKTRQSAKTAEGATDAAAKAKAPPSPTAATVVSTFSENATFSAGVVVLLLHAALVCLSACLIGLA